MTCAAEVGGVAICFQLLSGLPYRLLIPLAVLVLVVSSWVLPFAWLERVFGYLGLGLLVFAVAAIKLHPDWGQVAHGFVPGSHSGGSLSVYLYFVVGLLGAAMTPYEVYFYSSGAVEDRWGIKDLRLNNVTAIIGYALGGFLSFALMIVAARAVPAARASRPSSWARRRSPRSTTLGQVGLLLALVGILFAVGGAAVETSFAGAYNLAQFFGWRWGKKERPADASRFTLSWLVIFALALLVVMTGYDPVKLTEYSVIFSVVALPLTYLPILLVANDRTYMGAHANGRLANVLGVLLLRRDHRDRDRGDPADAAHERRTGMSKATRGRHRARHPRSPARRRRRPELRQGRRSRDRRPRRRLRRRSWRSSSAATPGARAAVSAGSPRGSRATPSTCPGRRSTRSPRSSR